MRTFIVRLQEDASGSSRPGTAAPRLRGVVDEVATGSRATFRNDQELVTALTAAMSADPAIPSWDGGDRAPREPSPEDQIRSLRKSNMSRTKFALTAAAAALLAAGCSSSATTTTPPTSTAPAVSTPKASAPASHTASAAAAATVGLSGKWSGQYSGAYQGTFVLRWHQSGSNLKGIIHISAPPSALIIRGTVVNGTIRFGTVGSLATVIDHLGL